MKAELRGGSHRGRDFETGEGLEGATVLSSGMGVLQGSIPTPVCRAGWEGGGSCLGSQCRLISAQHLAGTHLTEAQLA